jgi:hypothetical protein
MTAQPPSISKLDYRGATRNWLIGINETQKSPGPPKQAGLPVKSPQWVKQRQRFATLLP